MSRIRIIDSHTGGEPTRVIIAGGPQLGEGDLAAQRECFRDAHDAIRTAVILEPRGSDVLVGALLCPPRSAESAAGVIFFNNVGYLGMCGHGAIGVIATLAHLGRIGAGEHQLETPVGDVAATLFPDGRVAIGNVRSYRSRAAVPIDVPGFGHMHGDIAWGGNWFFLVNDHGLELKLANVARLEACSWAIRGALEAAGIRGNDGGEIDHVELFGPPSNPDADSRSYVMCPGGAYDRSPCGTGTSAKLACLVADGKLAEGQIWRQESIVGSVFEGSVQIRDGQIHPRIVGQAYITAESTLIQDPADPFRSGIGS
ncbi:MAG: 4-hydroxyproline epimerase [Rhodothermales bacterium]|jgi:4-hydroxyproline epimerase